MSATLDMAALLVARSDVPEEQTWRPTDPLDVEVTVSTGRTLVVVRIGDEVLVERAVPRSDLRSQWTAATAACAATIEEDVAALVARLDQLERTIVSFGGRSLSYVRWVSEANRGIGQVRALRGALPADGSDVAALRRGRAWTTDTDEALGSLEAALQALRSASQAESEPRFIASFDDIWSALQGRIIPLGELARPTLWCAAGQ